MKEPGTARRTNRRAKAVFFNLFKKPPPDPGDEPEPRASADLSWAGEVTPPPPPPTASLPPATPPASRHRTHHPNIPALLRGGLTVKLAPERQPGTPRTWDSRIARLDQEGFWVTQEKDPDSYLVKEGDTMTVVVVEQGERHIFDCPVLRIEHTPGNNRPNEVLLAPPVQRNKEFSSSTGQGKRKHLRIQADLPGECREVRPDHELGPPLGIHTLNVSLSGLAFTCNRSFDATREVDIRLLAWKFPLHLRATVVRSTRQPDGTYLVAIHFPPDISPITRDLISQFILDNQRSR